MKQWLEHRGSQSQDWSRRKSSPISTYLHHQRHLQQFPEQLTLQLSAEGQGSISGNTSSAVLPTNVLRKGAREYVDNYAGCAMQFPILTESEKKSSLGIAMTFIAGLFLTMSQHLTRERARAETIGLKLSSTTSIDNLDASYNDTVRKNS